MIERKKYGICLFVLLKSKNIFLAQQISGGSAFIPDRKRRKAYTNDYGHLLLFIIVNLQGGGGHLAGILPQIWPHSAGLGAPLAYQKSCKPETNPGEAFSRALKIEKLKATLFPGPEGYK